MDPVTSSVGAAPEVRRRRAITGLSAILLPHHGEPPEIDWPAFSAHVARTHDAGLTPAVNMDTGYVQLLDDAARTKALDIAQEVTAGDFVAGAFVSDAPGDDFDRAAMLEAADEIVERGGVPVIFPCHGLNASERSWVDGYRTLGEYLERFIGFELGAMFVPYGRIVGLDAYRELLGIESCVGAKHSSLSRIAEWQRLALRDATRPDFTVFTGNDLAIDMVMYGSDYLLGLSTMAPDAFAVRDRLWRAGDARFHELNDVLQYLGAFTFRAPVPGYRHDAAMVGKLRGWWESDEVPDGAVRRPDSDRDVLAEIVSRIDTFVAEIGPLADA